MRNRFLTKYTNVTVLDKIKDCLCHSNLFIFSVSFIEKSGLVLLIKDIEAIIESGYSRQLITSTYQNFTDIESPKSSFALISRFPN